MRENDKEKKKHERQDGRIGKKKKKNRKRWEDERIYFKSNSSHSKPSMSCVMPQGTVEAC